MEVEESSSSTGPVPVGEKDSAPRHLAALAQLDSPVSVPIERLLPADSPRLDGENEAHTRVLAESEADLPPILVHRATMRVIDGMHRLCAAALRGQDTIQVQFFDGPTEAVFVLAVEANIAHGLPLSLRDREAAAARILTQFPEWSDRAAAEASGLSARTVSAIRRRTDSGVPRLTARVGRDGRVRPLNNADGRRTAGEFIAANPTASLREIARDAGISLATARDVRARVQRGEDPILPTQRRADPTPVPSRLSRVRDLGSPTRPSFGRMRTILANLQRDPSLRFSESGRALLRWLDSRVNDIEAWNELIEAAPVHTSYLLIEFAQCYAGGWQAAADRLKSRLDAAG